MTPSSAVPNGASQPVAATSTATSQLRETLLTEYHKLQLSAAQIPIAPKVARENCAT